MSSNNENLAMQRIAKLVDENIFIEIWAAFRLKLDYPRK